MVNYYEKISGELKDKKNYWCIRHPLKSRRKFQTDRYPNEALMGEQVTVTRKTRGNNRKTAMKTANVVNVVLANGKTKSSEILKVLANQTNNDYQRRGVITKGAIVETKDGECKIVSRPGQDGTLNGILVK